MNVMTSDKFKEGYYYKFIGDENTKARAKEYWYVSPMYHILNGNWHKCISIGNRAEVKFDFADIYLSYIDNEYVLCESFVECSPEDYENIKDINWEVGATYFNREDESYSATIKRIAYNDQKVWTTNDLWINYLNYKNWIKEGSKESEEEFDRPFKYGDSIIVIKNKDHWKQDYVGCLWTVKEYDSMYKTEHFRLATEQEKIKHSLGLKPTANYVNKRDKKKINSFSLLGKKDYDVVTYYISDLGDISQKVNSCAKKDLLNHIEEDVQIEIHATKFSEITVTLPTPLTKGEKITICYTGYGSDENEYKSFSHRYYSKVDKNSDSSDIEYQSFSSKYVSLIKEK